jgi:hypothetical protein
MTKQQESGDVSEKAKGCVVKKKRFFFASINQVVRCYQELDKLGAFDWDRPESYGFTRETLDGSIGVGLHRIKYSFIKREIRGVPIVNIGLQWEEEKEEGDD